MSTQPIVRPAPSVLSGDRGIDNLLPNIIVPDVDPEIQFVRGNSAPLFTVTKAIRGRVEATQREFRWFSKDEYPRNSSLSAGTNPGDVTVNVAAGEGKYFYKNAEVLNLATREVFLVKSVANDALTTTALQGAMTAADPLRIIGSAHEEGAEKGALVSIKEDEDYNFCQTFRTAWGHTGREMNTKLWTGKDPKTEKAWQTIKHNQDVEEALMFGSRQKLSGVYTTGRELTMTGGLESFIKTNKLQLSNTIPTETQFLYWMEDVLNYGKGGYVAKGDGSKWLFCSPRWVSIINAWAHNKIQYTTADKRVGLKIGYWDCSHGTLVIVRHPLLTGPVHGGMAFVLDLNHITYRFHSGRDTHLRADIQAPSADAKELEWVTDGGLQVELEMAHGIATGLKLS
jgi:hypothetical protein